MVDAVFAIPGDLNTATGGYGYSRRVLDLLPALGVELRHLELPGAFPDPSEEDLQEAERRLAATPEDAVLLIDGLSFGTFPASMIKRLARRVIAVVHHPLALESGLSEERRAALAKSEKGALAVADHIIVTSPTTKATLVTDYAVEEKRITITEPGTDPALRATGTGTPMQLLSVGAVAPRKGYRVLVAALAELKDHDWRLTIAGPLDRDREAVAALEEAIANTGLSERITLAGVVVPATLERLYASTDIFIMPSLFEGYGMVLAEAMARGLPIICTTGGAAAVTVPDTASLKVPPGDAEALRDALVTALGDRKLRTRLADASWEAGRQLPTWNETARRVAAAVMDIHA